jgi:hypothetical protein
MDLINRCSDLRKSNSASAYLDRIVFKFDLNDLSGAYILLKLEEKNLPGKPGNF